jgi:hypothetical protein
MGKDYYKLLGVGREASDDEIKKGYKKMVCRGIMSLLSLRLTGYAMCRP